MEKQKLILPTSIIAGCLILGGFLFAAQNSKQQSIERQQEIKIQADLAIEEAKASATEDAELAKIELENKKYISDKREDCLTIYKTENGKWGNVNGWRYDEKEDACFVEYKEDKPKSEDACEKGYPIEGEYGHLNIRGKINCLNGVFEKQF